MPVYSQDTAMGVAIIVASLLLLARGKWFLESTKKGQRLTRWFGPSRAIWVLRGLILLSAGLGSLLATGMLRPLH